MRVLLTGVAGKLGSDTAPRLIEAGFDVLCTDITKGSQTPEPFEPADLTDLFAVYKLVAGCDAIVHLGNCPDERPDIRQCYHNNVTANMNVFRAAVDRGVKRIVFASSIQAMCGTRRLQESVPSKLPYLPLDSNMPTNPSNHYGLGKVAGEQALQALCTWNDMVGYALRLPMLVPDRHRRRVTRRFDGPPERYRLDEAMSWLTTADAARLIIACLQADRPADQPYRCYLPGARGCVYGMSWDEAIQRFYPNVPVRTDPNELDSLVDIRQITAETGWEPQDSLENLLADCESA